MEDDIAQGERPQKLWEEFRQDLKIHRPSSVLVEARSTYILGLESKREGLQMLSRVLKDLC